MPHLVDAHHIGARQTGNETWIRNISRELAAIADPAELAFAGTAAGAVVLQTLTGAEALTLSNSGVRRLALDLPRAVRKVSADSILVQYTMPFRAPAPCVVMVHDTLFRGA